MAARSIVSIYIPPGDLQKLHRLANAIQDAGSKDLERELAVGLRKAIAPMRKTFRRGALGFLPYRGGLAEEISADMRFRSQVTIGRSPRVRITAKVPGHDIAATNRGVLRHPTYGHREKGRWVTQTIRPGWWDDTGTLAAQDAADEIVNAINRVAAKLEASA